MEKVSQLRTELYDLEAQAIDEGLEETAYAYGGAAELLGCYELDTADRSKKRKYLLSLEANGMHAATAEEKQAWSLAAQLTKDLLDL